MDIKELIEKAVEQLTKDAGLKEKFQADPVKVLESILGTDLPADILEQVVTAVKGKLTVDAAGDALGMLKKLF